MIINSLVNYFLKEFMAILVTFVYIYNLIYYIFISLGFFSKTSFLNRHKSKMVWCIVHVIA